MNAATLAKLTAASDRPTALLAVSTAFRLTHRGITPASTAMADDREDGPWFEVFAPAGRRWTIVVILADCAMIVGPDGGVLDEVRIARDGLRPGDLVELIEAFAQLG